MTGVSEVIRGWLGWCPNAEGLRMAPVVLATPPATLNSPAPEGGAGRPGRIGRGISLAMGSLRILFRNFRLLGFALLTGAVMIFSLAASLSIQLISGTNPFPGTDLITSTFGILIVKGSLPWFALTYVTGFISTFLTYYLLAGLIVCVSYILAGQTISLREGLSRAGEHAQTLAAWAGIVAVLGTASSFLMTAGNYDIPVLALFMGVIYVIFALTMFVVPAIVLDNAGLIPAIRNSVSVFRKVWGEILVCFAILLLMAFVIYLVALIPVIYIGFSSGSAASAGFTIALTILVMIVIAFIGSTIVGIATLGLYRCGTAGTLPPAFEGTGSARSLS